MSGRCIACDDILSEREMKIKDDNGIYTDMCDTCKQTTYLAEHGYYSDDNSIDGILFGYAKPESYRE
jgi:hypothetical protein